MAFLVRYSESLLDDHARRKAIYLDQKFYELIFSHCQSETCPYKLLREISLLRYKSPTLLVDKDRVNLLAQELASFAASGISHSQLVEFIGICEIAQTAGLSLAISGDMYPELHG